MGTVHLGKGRTVTFNDEQAHRDPTLAEPPAHLKTECVRLMFDRATHARLRLIARAERKSVTELIRGLAEERAKTQSIYAHGKHTT
jgi:hypothetical protein